MVDLSIIIVNWNTRELLLGCLDSLRQNPPARSWDTWVIDNASEDGSVAAVQARHPDVQVIANSKNVGFAAANNQAIAACSGRYVLLLNSDTEVLPCALEALCAYLDGSPETGAVGCRLLNADGTTQRSCWRGYPGLRSVAIEGFYLWRILPFLAARREVTLGDHTSPQVVDHLLGACLLTRRSVIESIGLLDDDYFLFLEETDWCRRIQQAGWQVVYLPEPRIIHFGQQSMRQIPARTLPLYYSSLCRFVRKGGGRGLRMRLLLIKIAIAGSVIVRLGLWSLRLARDRPLGRRMLNGYCRVLRRLPAM